MEFGSFNQESFFSNPYASLIDIGDVEDANGFMNLDHLP